MIIAVTGATGLLGTNLIKHLLELEHQVIGIARTPKNFTLPNHPKLELKKADILQFKDLQKALENCDVVIHTAAYTSTNSASYKPYHRTNVIGTQNIIKAVAHHHIKKLIYVSTANTLGYGSKLNPGNELLPASSPFKESFYAKSKIEAENEVLEAVKNNKIKATIVNPTFMLGAYDTKPSSGRIIQIASKKIVFYPPGGKNFVNVSDVTLAICNAITLGKNGERYLLANENLSYKEFFSLVKKLTGKPVLLIPLSKWLLRTIGLLGDFLGVLKINTSITSLNMKTLCVKNYYTNSKAQKELNINFAPISKGITDAKKN